MKSILTPNETLAADRKTMAETSLPPSTLVENAARGIFDTALSHTAGQPGERVWLIFCGPGNNGADGLALARMAASRGDKVHVRLTAATDDLNEEATRQLQACTTIDSIDWSEWDGDAISDIPGENVIIVDAMFGVSQRPDVPESVQDAIRFLNSLRGTRIAADIPTGLDPLTGEAGVVVFRADATATMGALKRGLLFNDGPKSAGSVQVINLGVPTDYFRSDVNLLDRVVAYDGTPAIGRTDHKYLRGRLLIAGGSPEMVGAPVLASSAALSSGVGLVHIATASPAFGAVRALAPPETLVSPIDDASDTPLTELLRSAGEKADAIVAGPGLGNDSAWLSGIRSLTALSDAPIVLDADTLYPSYLDDLEIGKDGRMVVLTPHHGEAARIMQRSLADIARDPVGSARELASRWNAIVVLKGAPTVISDRSGHCWVNDGGNPGMATAGSGDVLAGLIGGFLAMARRSNKSTDLTSSILSAVWLHSRAGDLTLESCGSPYPVSATGIIENLAEAISELGAGERQ